MAFDAVAKVLITVQHKLFYIIMALARFNLYANSYIFLAKTAFQPKRAKGGRWWWWAEIICIGFFYSWYLRVLKGCGSWPTALGYLLISNVVPSPLHVQVNLFVRFVSFRFGFGSEQSVLQKRCKSSFREASVSE